MQKEGGERKIENTEYRRVRQRRLRKEEQKEMLQYRADI